MKASEMSVRERATQIALLLFPATMLLLLVVPGAFAQSITNGNFEAVPIGYPFVSADPNAVPGWVHTGSAGDGLLWGVGYADGGGSVTTAGAGNQFVTMGGGSGAIGSADWSTTITGLTPGASYVLSFMTSTETSSLPQTMTVSFSSGSSTAAQAFTPPLSSANYWRTWVTEHYAFVATASSATVHFSVTNQQQDMGLDNVSVAPASGAQTLEYVFTGTASGTVGSTSFTNAPLTVSTIGDTSTVVFTSPIFRLNVSPGGASFSIGGVGSGTFTDATYVFDNQTAFGGSVGFGDSGLPAGFCCDIIQIHDMDFNSTVFAGYDLKSPIGPLGFVTDPSVADWVNAPTSLGNMTITSYTNVSFQSFQGSQVQTTPPVNYTGTTTDTTVPTVFSNTAGQYNESDVISPPFTDLSFPAGSDPATLRFTTTNVFVADPDDDYTHDTPFATFKHFDVASNDALAGTAGNGAKYEVRCSDNNNPTPSEADCPFASTPGTHIRHKMIIDSTGTPPSITPGTTVAYLHWPPGPTLTASATSWSPSTIRGAGTQPNCTSVTYPAFACDIEQILVNKYGGTNSSNKYAPNGFGSDKKKGDYFLGYNVPEPCTAVKVNGKAVNTPCVQGGAPFYVHSPLTFDFVVSPAKCPTGMVCGNGWIPAPVSKLFYHFDPLNNAPDYPAMLADLNDLDNCPGGDGTSCTVTSGTPGASGTANVKFTTTPPIPEPEGVFLLQQSAADTVKLRELNVQLLNAGPCPDPFPNDPNRPAGGWAAPCYSTKLFNEEIIVDNTAPTVTNLTLTPNTQIPGKTITASYTCADNGSAVANSGLASCGTNLNLNLGTEPGPLGPLNLSDTPFTVPQVNGPQTYNVTATDVAGNTFTATGHYFAGYQFFGFFNPVQDPAPGVTIAPQGGFVNPVINVIKAGRTVPVKWQVLDGNGVGVTGLTLSAVNGGPGGTVVLTAQNSTVCAHDTVDNNILVDAAGNSGLQDLGGGNYQFNWKTVLPSGACVVLSVNPGDGTQHQAFFYAK